MIFSQLLTLSEKTNQKEIFMSGTRQLFLEWHPCHSSVTVFCLINSVDVVFTLKLPNHTIILLQARMAQLVAHQLEAIEIQVQTPPGANYFKQIFFYIKHVILTSNECIAGNG